MYEESSNDEVKKPPTPPETTQIPSTSEPITEKPLSLITERNESLE
jgi:hypothetical protein